MAGKVVVKLTKEVRNVSESWGAERREPRAFFFSFPLTFENERFGTIFAKVRD